ncbi:MAG: M18 family aminopeptidase [Nocardioidaceae bacterium]|nr:M18 family aminopeptidase [Nocardioidaceae bacterium]
MSGPVEHADDLCAFIDACPSPFHVCAHVGRLLDAAGFTRLSETDTWPREPGRHYVVRGGSLVAWASDTEGGPATPFRIIGAHTDSPNLRVKQHPDLTRAGWQLVALEPYGGAWLNSWLDRDLGLSGRVSVRTRDGADDRLIRIDEPVLRVPQLAIHLSADRNGVELDPQQHLNGIWAVGASGSSFRDVVAGLADVAAAAVLGWELMTHDLTGSRRVGAAKDMISAPRLDNQGTCYAGACALLDAAGGSSGSIPVLALFDHEEVGSLSARGAASDLLVSVLERVSLGRGADRQDYLRALAGSLCASGDMAHATHPNYPDRHEPAHHIAANGGPVLKVHQNLRYATDAAGAAAFALACEQADVPLQRYMHRADLPCGSTIGPITAGRTGVTTVDVGAPQLAMHSARELMGAADPAMYVAALTAFLAPDSPAAATART